MKVCVIIPAYNEANKITNIISGVKEQGFLALVVDDGSKDSTAQIAAQSGAVVLSNLANEGKGVSLKNGFAYALKNDYDAVITMDGDGQHLPEELAHFIDSAQKSAAGIFIGNRMSNSRNMPWERFITNKFMSWLISRITGQNIPDTQCGYRLIKKEVLQKLYLKTNKFEVESEILIQAARLGFRIETLPVKTVYNGTKSQINPLFDAFRFSRYILKVIAGN